MIDIRIAHLRPNSHLRPHRFPVIYGSTTRPAGGKFSNDFPRAGVHVDRLFLAGLKIVNRRITSLTQDSLDALHHQIMNLRALIKGNFAQRFVDRC